MSGKKSGGSGNSLNALSGEKRRQADRRPFLQETLTSYLQPEDNTWEKLGPVIRGSVCGQVSLRHACLYIPQT